MVSGSEEFGPCLMSALWLCPGPRLLSPSGNQVDDTPPTLKVTETISIELLDATGTPELPPEAIIGIAMVSTKARLQNSGDAELLSRAFGLLRFMLLFP